MAASRSLLYRLLQYGAPAVSALTADKLRVLAYHTVPQPDKYDDQLAYLRSNYNLVSLADVLTAVRNKTELPKRSVLITFDDGERSVYEAGLPLHIKYGLPAVLFIITGLIGTNEPFWWKKVEMHYAAQGLTYVDARNKVKELKELPDSDRRSYLGTLPTTLYQTQLTRLELRELDNGGITLANHTATHPLVNKCSETEFKEELMAAKRFFTSLGVGYPRVFAYPNGNATSMAEAVLVQQGIDTAFLFDHALATQPLNPLRISRIRVNTYDPLPEFKAKISGLHSFIYHRQFS